MTEQEYKYQKIQKEKTKILGSIVYLIIGNILGVYLISEVSFSDISKEFVISLFILGFLIQLFFLYKLIKEREYKKKSFLFIWLISSIAITLFLFILYINIGE